MFIGLHLSRPCRTHIYLKELHAKHGNVFCALYGQDAAGTESGVPQRKTVGVPVAPLEHSVKQPGLLRRRMLQCCNKPAL